MARSWLSNYLQAHTFWLVDIGPTSTLALPVLTPLFGFASVTAPEMSLDVENIREGNWPFDHKVVKSASLSSITLTRGVTIYDADFYNWAKAAVYGDVSPLEAFVPGVKVGGPTYRRDLMLIHFMNRCISSPGKGGDPNPGVGIGNSAYQAGLAAAGNAAYSSLNGDTSGGGIGSSVASGAMAAGTTMVLSTALNYLLGDAFDFAARIPGVVYVLYGAIPRRLKVDSDFDAKSADISIAELELEIDMFERIGLF